MIFRKEFKMAAVKSITSPMKFLIQAGLLAELGKHIKQYGDAGLIICDPFIAEKAAADSKASLAEHGVKGVFTVFGGESSDEEINRQQAEFDQAGCRFVVGIGGGKTLDTAKAVAYYKNVPVVIFPTLASTDAPCTALTVVYNADGSFNRYLFLPNNPNAVLADTKLLAAEPARFFAAGVGDGLATYFEARTCYASNGINLVLMQPSLAGGDNPFGVTLDADGFIVDGEDKGIFAAGCAKQPLDVMRSAQSGTSAAMKAIQTVRGR